MGSTSVRFRARLRMSTCVVVLALFLVGSVVFFLLSKADQITEENADRIHEGMSAAEVISVLGREPDSKGDEVWIWNRRRLEPSDDPDALIHGFIVVQFDSRQKVECSTYAIESVDATWFDRMRAKVGF